MPDTKTSSNSSKVDCDSKGNLQRYTNDGALIEGTGIGGQVLIVQKTPEFMRDIAPYFAPSVIIVFAHLVNIYTGNLLLPIWLMYLACPICTLLA
jgi:hypothetical protein